MYNSALDDPISYYIHIHTHNTLQVACVSAINSMLGYLHSTKGIVLYNMQ